MSKNPVQSSKKVYVKKVDLAGAPLIYTYVYHVIQCAVHAQKFQSNRFVSIKWKRVSNLGKAINYVHQ
jgi:hypothetical protein